MQNKEMKAGKHREKHAPQAGSLRRGSDRKEDTVEQEKAADTQSEFNVEQRRQERYQEQ